MSPSNNTTPISVIAVSFSSLNGFPLTPSTRFKRSLPPSSPGIGNKFMSPKLILRKPIKLTRPKNPPVAATSPVKLKIATGPPNSSTENPPVKSPAMLCEIWTVKFHVFLNPNKILSLKELFR